MSPRRWIGPLVVILSLLSGGCGPSEEEKQARQVQEQVRLLQEQVTALEEGNASLKASVAKLQTELDRMSVELTAQGERVAWLKSTVGLLQEQPKSRGFWTWLWAKVVFLFKLLVVVGLVWMAYYFFLQRRQRRAGQEVQRVLQNQGSGPAQGRPGSGPPDPSSGAADPGSPPNPSAAPGASRSPSVNFSSQALGSETFSASGKGCQVPGCQGRHRSKGYCNKHYQQYRMGTLALASAG